jgi:hypothetical protein
MPPIIDPGRVRLAVLGQLPSLLRRRRRGRIRPGPQWSCQPRATSATATRIYAALPTPCVHSLAELPGQRRSDASATTGHGSDRQFHRHVGINRLGCGSVGGSCSSLPLVSSGVVARDASLAGGRAGEAGGIGVTIGRSTPALKAAFRTLNVPKAAFMALVNAPPVPPATPDPITPITMDNSLQRSHTQ